MLRDSFCLSDSSSCHGRSALLGEKVLHEIYRGMTVWSFEIKQAKTIIQITTAEPAC
tara:strand:+ start:198 stop:368 length:171 start_codon:yes stop_codon:yes gene_type:complete